MATGPSTGGAFQPDADYTLSGTITATGTFAAASATTTQKPRVISGSGAIVTLTAAQSGSLCLFDRAAGIVFTLPAPSVGVYFDFSVSTSVTSNAHKVITSGATIFLIGSLINIDTDTANAVAAWTADGSTIVSASMNGTTTGGLIGTLMRVQCVTSTLWMVSGIDQGSGTVATPFATS